MSVQTNSEKLAHLESRILTYYTDYYRDTLGFQDWRKRVASRLNEENLFSSGNINLIEKWLNYSFNTKKVLIVGAGTGGETFALINRGAEVTAIEPQFEAVKIIADKARFKNNIKNPSIQASGEYLPFVNDYFDFVYCYTVLEHTSNPELCIDEMIRIVRPGGWVFIETPDYRHFYEPHYKVTIPMFAPKWLLRLWLRHIKRPVEFLDTLQFVTSRKLRKIFQSHPVTAFQIIHSWPKSWFSKPNLQIRLSKWITETFGIQRDQWWLLQKLKQNR